jgi:hypothetical protein
LLDLRFTAEAGPFCATVLTARVRGAAGVRDVALPC